MSNKRKIVNPYFNEFVYTIVYNTPVADRQHLDKKYIQATSSAARLRHFIEKSSMEEKDELLTQLGIQWAKVYFETGYPQKRHLRDCLMSFKLDSGNRSAYLADAVKNRLFIYSDREFAYQLSLMTPVQNNPIYKQSLLLERAGFHLQRWPKEMSDGESDKALEAAKVSDYLSDTVLNTILTYEFVEGLVNLHHNDIKILLYLYKRRRFIKAEDIHTRFSANITKQKVTSCLRRLYQGQFILKGFKILEYQISALGIMKVNTVLQTILKSNSINL